MTILVRTLEIAAGLLVVAACLYDIFQSVILPRATHFSWRISSQLVRRTLRDIEPHARELGCERELEGIREILSRGSSADGQLRIFNANRDIVEVVHAIADATEAATPAPAAVS